MKLFQTLQSLRQMRVVILQNLSAAFSALRSIPPYQHCFELAARGRDAEALSLVVRTRERTLNNRFARWDVELQLLEAFLHLEMERLPISQITVVQAISRLRNSNVYSFDERSFLIRYALSILWLTRGRLANSCLLVIRHSQKYDVTNVDKSMLRRFSSHDEM